MINKSVNSNIRTNNRSTLRSAYRTFVVGDSYNCSTKVITNSLRAKILAGGGTVGNLKCVSTYLDTNFTTDSKAECTTMSLRTKIEAGGGIAGDLTCVENYLSLNFYD